MMQHSNSSPSCLAFSDYVGVEGVHRGNFPDWPNIISVSVVPVVILSACGLLSLAFYGRLAALVARLRTFQREMLRAQERWAKEGLEDHCWKSCANRPCV